MKQPPRNTQPIAETINLSDPPPRRRFSPVRPRWTAIAAIMALILNTQQELPLWWAIPSSLFYFYVLGILVWIACRVHARFKLWKQRPPRVLAAHAGLGIVAIMIWIVVELGFYRIVVGPHFSQRVYADSWIYQLLTATLAYAASLGLGLTVQGFDREGERQRREAQLEVDAREAELAAISNSRNPTSCSTRSTRFSR